MDRKSKGQKSLCRFPEGTLVRVEDLAGWPQCAFSALRHGADPRYGVGSHFFGAWPLSVACSRFRFGVGPWSGRQDHCLPLWALVSIPTIAPLKTPSPDPRLQSSFSRRFILPFLVFPHVFCGVCAVLEHLLQLFSKGILCRFFTVKRRAYVRNDHRQQL